MHVAKDNVLRLAVKVLLNGDVEFSLAAVSFLEAFDHFVHRVESGFFSPDLQCYLLDSVVVLSF